MMKMNHKKPMSARDEKVYRRNMMLSMVMRGCDLLNKGNRNALAGALKYIHNSYKNGWSVDCKPESKHELFHYTYTKDDGMIVVKEDGKDCIVIVQLKEGQCKGEWRVYEVDYYDFRYDDDLEAEAKWEQDSETAYERYLDYKASFDDPRSY